MRTGGFIPSKPLGQNIYPGDFFQIKDGEMIVLGNIFRQGIVDADNCNLGYGIKLNPANWNFKEGVTKPYSGRGTGSNAIEGAFEYSKQVLEFKQPGSYMFKGVSPEAVKIANWSEIKDELIIKLTQTFYSFRELYLVTECATTESWTLAIASHKRAELEIVTEDENSGLVDIFGHSSSKTIQSKNIEFYHREENRIPTFFKAKKLVVQQEKLETFISELISNRMNQYEWANDYFDYDFYEGRSSYSPRYNDNIQASVLDMLQANQLNPNTALLYFQWADLNLDDIQKLFIIYEKD
jgi:hypothetical protein